MKLNVTINISHLFSNAGTETELVTQFFLIYVILNVIQMNS